MTDPKTLPQQNAQGESPASGTPVPAPKRRRRHPRLTMNADLAELVGEAKVPPEVALQRLGFSRQSAKRAMKSDLLRMVLLRKMEEEGLTDEYFARKLKQHCDAEYVEVAKHLGAITETRAFPDFPTQHTALRTTAEIRGLLNSGSHQRPGSQDERPILHIHAGAKVEMMLFGEVTGESRQDDQK